MPFGTKGPPGPTSAAPLPVQSFVDLMFLPRRHERVQRQRNAQSQLARTTVPFEVTLLRSLIPIRSADSPAEDFPEMFQRLSLVLSRLNARRLLVERTVTLDETSRLCEPTGRYVR
jgi:hypothetical protein